ncbi:MULTISPECIES: flavodoxin family protein [unclassified Pseudofrankia]|uniref:flavodoxin family protein n=1 Tax=unclassified Pseudofrankia TaxID=2994372 RepID=UPI0008DA118F|nr:MULTISPECIES: flavodoxin family protein [unclassified Pseudofrankia]MDT3445468.1 flavodoxin family protein [Pseudofrankia sp. BMG5.37]OHV67498.1 hypothetical protein BCD48_35240 [Pseudofrankia sp. BMG5.36]
MRALVVFESMFGNTKEIAEAVAASLGERMDAELVEVGAAPTTLTSDVDLLVVGGPTHVLGMSRPNSRQDAARQLAADAEGPAVENGVISPGIGIREWLASVELGRPAPAVAVFDTRARSPLAGSAAAKAARLLRRRGANVVGRRSFYVTGTRGPLRDGEPDQARRWAADLAARPATGGAAGETAGAPIGTTG